MTNNRQNMQMGKESKVCTVVTFRYTVYYSFRLLSWSSRYVQLMSLCPLQYLRPLPLSIAYYKQRW